MYLTPRETELLALCALDLKQTEAAARLGITNQTAKNLLASARRRLRVRTTTGAVYLALKQGFIK
jgi:DNA-binding CsgD family transcriptional regulator